MHICSISSYFFKLKRTKEDCLIFTPCVSLINQVFAIYSFTILHRLMQLCFTRACTGRSDFKAWFQFVVFKSLSYCFKETIGFDVKASFARPPPSVSHLFKPGEKAIQFHRTFCGFIVRNWYWNVNISKYFSNDVSKVNHFTSLVFLYHVWLLVTFIFTQIVFSEWYFHCSSF